jgi:hypothetical protein
MSTRSQIGFYDSDSQDLNHPSALIYRHPDGYPDTEHGVLAALVPWAQDFAKRRGLAGEAEYASARAIVALIRHSGQLNDVLGYGICGDHDLHGDIEYHYAVRPTRIDVYAVPFGATFAKLSKLAPCQTAQVQP